MKILKNIKNIYLGIQSYIFKGLKLSSFGAAKGISIACSIIITTIIIIASAIEGALWLLYQTTNYIEYKVSPEISITESTKIWKLLKVI